MTNSQSFLCLWFSGGQKKREKRGQELMVTHVHASRFQELIPILISNFGSIRVHLNQTTFILSYAFGFLTSKNV